MVLNQGVYKYGQRGTDRHIVPISLQNCDYHTISLHDRGVRTDLST